MQQVVIKSITIETLAYLLEKSTPQQSIDTGPTLVSVMVHDDYGLITVVTNIVDDVGVVMVSPKFAAQIP